MRSGGSFWDRRRAAVRAEAEADARAEQAREADDRAARRAERSDDEVLAEMGLPDPAGMRAGDDFAAFMSSEVPEHLRRRALRTLWRSNPTLACLDGLNDYDDDYRAAAAAQSVFKTAYQVGRGLTRHVEEMALQARSADDAAAPQVEAEAAQPCDLPADAAHMERAEPPAREEPEASAATEATSAETVGRRMRFRFEEAAT